MTGGERGRGGERRAGRATPWVKICGITRPEDAARAAALGADLLGLNFHPSSPRVLDPGADAARLAEIADAAARGTVGGDRPLLAGVFVHHSAEAIEEIAEAARLDLIQLHGGQDAAEAARFGTRAIRVFRQAGAEGLTALAAELARHPPVWGFLFDTPPETARSGDGSDPYGGTGESWDHGAVRRVTHAESGGRPVLIAGGIRPENVRAALAASGATGVDVCSGVEAAPGVKDDALMRRLFEEIHDARRDS